MPSFSESEIDTYYDKINYYCKKIGIGYNLEPLEKNINILHNKKITIMNEYLKQEYTRDIFLELYTQKMVDMNIYKECISKTIGHILNAKTYYVEDTHPVSKSKKITTKKKIIKKARISDSEYDTDDNDTDDNHKYTKSGKIGTVITDKDLIQFDKILNEIYEITGSDMDYINPIIEEFIDYYNHFDTNTTVDMVTFCNIMKTIAKCTKNVKSIARIIHKVIVLSIENADIHIVFSRELSKIVLHEFSEHVQYIFHCMSVSLERDRIINSTYVFKPETAYVPLDFDKYIGIKKDIIIFFEFVKSLKHVFSEPNVAINKEDDGYDDIARIFTQNIADMNSPRNKLAYYDNSDLLYTP
jgi:hypothetical protein